MFLRSDFFDRDGANGRPIISQIVVRGDTIYVCGVTPDPVGDITSRTQQALDRIDALLK
jgi:enamine deaminase RidA (YjgF/YER057c/UK114 family)